ncbi:hypothetical protein QQF64_000337 [Cirrhinus molitorella]|uniref:Apoptosis-associated speck-like protein containing a CARD n=1 Tax=Cirrhinus molitorella TaxID=172907 RepID=A0ABR3NWV8_9TELE
MASVKELLVNSLEELLGAELKTFQWHLKNGGHASASEMEKADILNTVDKLVESFGPEEAVKMTVAILRKMNKNYLATQLEERSAKNQKDELNPKRVEPCLNTVADKAHIFNNRWPDLIQRVKNVNIIADKLLQQKIIHEEQYSKITHDNLTPADSMRKMCAIIRSQSDNVKAKFISVLQQEEPYLFEELSKSTP